MSRNSLTIIDPDYVDFEVLYRIQTLYSIKRHQGNRVSLDGPVEDLVVDGEDQYFDLSLSDRLIGLSSIEIQHPISSGHTISSGHIRVKFYFDLESMTKADRYSKVLTVETMSDLLECVPDFEHRRNLIRRIL